MKVDFRIGIHHRVLQYYAHFDYTGRSNGDCNAIALRLVKLMNDTIDQSIRDEKILPVSVEMAKAAARCRDTMHVEAELIPMHGKLVCKVTFNPNDPRNAWGGPMKVRMTYKFADCLCEYVKEMRRHAARGELPKAWKSIELVKSIPSWKECGLTEAEKNGEG